MIITTYSEVLDINVLCIRFQQYLISDQLVVKQKAKKKKHIRKKTYNKKKLCLSNRSSSAFNKQIN